MKHRFYTRAVSLLLIFGLLLTGLALPVFAVPASDANNSSNTPIPNDEWLVSNETVAQVGGLVPIEESEGLQEAVVDIFMPFSYLLVGQTKQISYTINSPGLSIAWNSENTSIATVNSSGAVTGVSEGSVKITATYTDPSTAETVIRNGYVYVYDSLGIVNHANYYIMNYASGRFLSRASALEADPTVNTRPRDPSMLTQWQMEKQSDSPFQLVNVYSIYGKVLNVTGTDINASVSTGADNQKFAVYRIYSGAYKGYYHIRYGESYIAQASDYSLYLTDTVTGSAVWSFMAVDKRSADYYSVQRPSSQGLYDNYDDAMSSLGYTTNNWHCTSAYNAYWHLQHTNDIFTFVGHGAVTGNNQGKAAIRFDDSSGYVIGHITTNKLAQNEVGDYAIDDLPKNALALARCVLYLGCQTGVSYTVDGVSYNLVDATFNKGAHFVLGTLEDIYLTEVETFLDRFLEDCSEKNIKDCLKTALGADPLFSVYYMGDVKQFLSVS